MVNLWSYPEIWNLESNEEKSIKIKQLVANYLYKDILKFNEIKILKQS